MLARSQLSLLRPIALLLACLALAGCAVPISRPAAKISPKPYLLHLPGIGGETAGDDLFLVSLTSGGFDADDHLFDWTNHQLPLQALRAYKANHRQAKKIAALIEGARRENPLRKIFLSAESGGAGPAIWALEDLPDDVHVDGVVLISPALSPEYDLTRALRHVDGKMLVFSSPLDSFVLSFGTTQYGTIDGRREPAAGLCGFSQPADADDAQYQKIEACRYDPDWLAQYGNGGGHVEAMGVRFASGYIAPLMCQLAIGMGQPELLQSRQPTDLKQK